MHGLARDNYRPVAFYLLTSVLLMNILCMVLIQVEGKGMARGGMGRSGASGRTYLKKFGSRSVVYQRKIFNTKYQSPQEIGYVGHGPSDKFKRKVSDGTASKYVYRKHTTLPPIINPLGTTDNPADLNSVVTPVAIPASAANYITRTLGTHPPSILR